MGSDLVQSESSYKLAVITVNAGQWFTNAKLHSNYLEGCLNQSVGPTPLDL